MFFLLNVPPMESLGSSKGNNEHKPSVFSGEAGFPSLSAGQAWAVLPLHVGSGALPAGHATPLEEAQPAALPPALYMPALRSPAHREVNARRSQAADSFCGYCTALSDFFILMIDSVRNEQ